MTHEQRTTVVGVFNDRDAARDAIAALKDAGFSAQDISILTPDKRETADLAEETGTHAGSGAATGAVAGGILGGLGGWLVGIGALAIPGVGPFIAAGAFATALGGAAIGAGVGAIAGALIGMGVPEEEAKYYEGEVKSGRTLVTVRAAERYAEARALLQRHGAYDIESSRRYAGETTGVAAGPTRSQTAGSQTLELREEELQARKTPVQTGEVTLGKDVIEQQRTMDVPVTREEVYVERRAVDRPADRPIEPGSEKTIDVPVREEQVEVEKRPVVYEEVEVGKQQVQETQRVSDTVRREEARIEREGDVRTSGGDADEIRT
ncbi:MAG: YsnF/AvaK domain-containing protein [Chloroflexi bacterium]|nr:YsnF/AvaK domain-containing protein [Chloroflexota bacterium]MBV9598503.1 YsnF/AvaK domain-containing protein [Chloroflexota bacterium]